MEILIQFLMFMTALFLVVLILLQRGRGGGLAGALGGAGGQSAFGSKAGDMFTKITSGVAIFWILLCIASLKYMSSTVIRFDSTAGGGATTNQPADQALPVDPQSQDGKSDGAGDESKTKKSADQPARAKGTASSKSKARSKGTASKGTASKGTAGASKPARPPAEKND